MQSGLDRLVAGARQAGIYRRCGRLCVLLLGLMVSALREYWPDRQPRHWQSPESGDSPQQMSVAVESIDGPPPAVHEKFMRALKDEAGARQITVVTSGEANYRLRGYLAAHAERRRDVDHLGLGRLRCRPAPGVPAQGQGQGRRGRGRLGERRRSGAAPDRAQRPRSARRLRRGAPPADGRRRQPAPATARRKRGSSVAWLDDWAPEAAGIFRIFRRRRSPSAESPAAPADRRRPRRVPLPRGRPVAGRTGRPSALAFAPEAR